MSSIGEAIRQIYLQSIKRRVFVSYHHGGDQAYYDEFSEKFDNVYGLIHDRSLEDPFRSDDTDYVIRQIRERHISGTSCTIILVGRDTWGRKYVDWETKATLDKQHGLIGIKLPSATITKDGSYLAPLRFYQNWASGFALTVNWEYIMANPRHLGTMIGEANLRSHTKIQNREPLQFQNRN